MSGANYINYQNRVLKLLVLMLLSIFGQAQTTVDTSQLQKIARNIDSLSRLGQTQIANKNYTQAVRAAQKALLTNIKEQINPPFLSEKGLTKLLDCEYYYPSKVELLISNLYTALLTKYGQKNNLQDLNLVHQLNQVQLKIYYQQYLNSSAGLQAWYIGKYQKTWLRALTDARRLEHITNNSALWSAAFGQLQLLKAMELSYAQKNGQRLWASNLSVSGLSKIFKQFYKAESTEKSLATIRNSIDAQTAILDYYWIGDQFKLFYIDQKTIGIYEGYLESKQLENYILDLNRAMKQPILDSLDKLYTEAAHELYKTLLGVIVQESIGIQHFIICPHQGLAHIPFDVLLMERADTNDTYDSLKYIAKDYAISYSYSATMIQDTTTLLKLTDLAANAIGNNYKNYRKQGETGSKALQKAKIAYMKENKGGHPAQWGNWLKLGCQDSVDKPKEGSSIFPFLLGLICLGFVTYKAQKK